MGAHIIDGKVCAASIEASLKPRVDQLISKGFAPHLAVIIVGNDPASHVYVRAKERACERLGIRSTKVLLPADIDFEQVVDQVIQLNNDPTIHGILVQSPLPRSTLVDESGPDSPKPATRRLEWSTGRLLETLTNKYVSWTLRSSHPRIT